jgi:predicted transcriptional regulator
MVNKILLHPQEVETFYILPTIRRYLALFMKEQGMKQKDVAEILGISSATISQYTSEKRGHVIDFDKEILGEIRKSSLKIKDKLSYMSETQRILQLIRKKKIVCTVHRRFSELPKRCNPEEVGCHLGTCMGCSNE